MYHLNLEVYNHSPSYILAIPLCICILKANEHYQHHCRALHHTSVATCWWFSYSCLRPHQIGSDFRNRIGCPTPMYHLNVEVYNHSPSYILVIPLCICILKANEHYQHHCRALHHTSVATIVGGSLASSDWVIFSKLNRLSDANVSPKRGGIQPLSFLYIGNSFIYMYIEGQ